MRVLHVHSGNLYGGVETMLSTLARRRDSCPGMEPHFALCFEGRLAEELRDSGARVHRLPGVRVSRPASVVRARRSLAALLREESFDVAVCHSTWTQAVFGKVVRAASLPLVFWSHDAPRGTHWLERWARRTPPDFVICNSHYTASALGSLYPRARAEVVYCPVELPDLTPYRTPESRAAVRAELDTPSDAAVIIQVSRMEAWKGQKAHLDALKALEGVGGLVCWFVGGAQRASEVRYMRALKNRAERLGITGRVRFLGQRADVPRLLAAADIFCQPNTEPEPFGLVFIEALRSRLPVVATDTGAAREIVEENCGMLLPRGDIVELSRALRTLIENRALRARLGRQGPGRARTLCDPTAQLARLHEVLEGCVRKVREAA
jgi:glycosyltransferase involved in cell wall biosynthesis